MKHAHTYIHCVHYTTHCVHNIHQGCNLLSVCAQVLDQVSPNPDEVIQEKALENPTKNRSQEFLPSLYM